MKTLKQLMNKFNKNNWRKGCCNEASAPSPPPVDLIFHAELQLEAGATTYTVVEFDQPFTIISNSVSTNYPAGELVACPVTADMPFTIKSQIDMLPNDVVKIGGTGILTINVINIGGITSLDRFLYNTRDATNITISADTSMVTNFDSTFGRYSGSTFPWIDTSSGTNFNGTWDGCYFLESFPELDFSNGTNFNNTFNEVSDFLTCFKSLDFSSLTSGTGTFADCIELIQPPSTGTSVRSGNNATAGVWTNPGACP